MQTKKDKATLLNSLACGEESELVKTFKRECDSKSLQRFRNPLLYAATPNFIYFLSECFLEDWNTTDSEARLAYNSTIAALNRCKTIEDKAKVSIEAEQAYKLLFMRLFPNEYRNTDFSKEQAERIKLYYSVINNPNGCTPKNLKWTS